jgi:hypothetical protein
VLVTPEHNKDALADSLKNPSGTTGGASIRTGVYNHRFHGGEELLRVFALFARAVWTTCAHQTAWSTPAVGGLTMTMPAWLWRLKCVAYLREVVWRADEAKRRVVGLGNASS